MNKILKYFLDQKPLSNSDLKSYRMLNKKFTDEYFPPTDFSLFSANEKGVFMDQNLGFLIAKKFTESLKYKPKWKRISEMPELNNLYDDKNFSFEYILQGSIGDCYLISELCEISQYPKLLINKDKNSINIIHKYDEYIGYLKLNYL